MPCCWTCWLRLRPVAAQSTAITPVPPKTAAAPERNRRRIRPRETPRGMPACAAMESRLHRPQTAPLTVFPRVSRRWSLALVVVHSTACLPGQRQSRPLVPDSGELDPISHQMPADIRRLFPHHYGPGAWMYFLRSEYTTDRAFKQEFGARWWSVPGGAPGGYALGGYSRCASGGGVVLDPDRPMPLAAYAAPSRPARRRYSPGVQPKRETNTRSRW